MLSWIAALLIGVAIAGDESFYVEGPYVETRADASAMAHAAGDLGHRAKVVRRFAQGEGWRFILRLEGFEDQAAAEAAATEVARAIGRGLVVYAVDSGDARRVQEIVAGPSDVAPAPQVEGDQDAAALVQRAVAAHGGETHPVRTAERVLFRFRRRLPDGMVVLHTVARRGQDVYVEVDVEEGAGADSRTWLLTDSAYLSVASAAAEPKDAVWAREQLARFLPESVLALPLGFGVATRERPEMQLLYADGVAVVDGAACHRLRYDGDRVTGPLALYLDTTTLLIRGVASAAGTEQVFGDYRDVAPGAVAPFRMRVFRGDQAVDDVEVLDLDLDPDLRDTWFQAPEVATP